MRHLAPARVCRGAELDRRARLELNGTGAITQQILQSQKRDPLWDERTRRESTARPHNSPPSKLLRMRATSYFGSMQPCEATTCQRPFWFTKTSVHRVFPLISFPL